MIGAEDHYINAFSSMVLAVRMKPTAYSRVNGTCRADVTITPGYERSSQSVSVGLIRMRYFLIEIISELTVLTSVV